MGLARRAALLSVLALASCGIDERGAAGPGLLDGGSAGSGGSNLEDGGWTTGGTSGAAGTGNAAGVAGVAGAGGASGGASGAAASGGAAGAGGAAGVGGTGASGGACSAVHAACASPDQCCSGLCGPGVAVDPDDCNTADKCAQCDDDATCPSGRCDDCGCLNELAPGGSCNESSDCTSDKCGPGIAADSADCATYDKCAACDDDSQCPSSRCDACSCQNKLAAGGSCNENSDCVSDLCGPSVIANADDCSTADKCAQCDDDYQCPSGRCDACSCQGKLGPGGNCDEDSDCVNDDCSGGKCK